MTYTGHVEKGVIVLDEPVTLEEGAVVAVDIIPGGPDPTSLARQRYEHYRDLIGALKDMPEDWSENHDKYLREEQVS